MVGVGDSASDSKTDDVKKGEEEDEEEEEEEKENSSKSSTPLKDEASEPTTAKEEEDRPETKTVDDDVTATSADALPAEVEVEEAGNSNLENEEKPPPDPDPESMTESEPASSTSKSQSNASSSANNQPIGAQAQSLNQSQPQTANQIQAQSQQQQQQQQILLQNSSNSKKQKNKKSKQKNFDCPYCNVRFSAKEVLQIHCRSQAHQLAVMSDEGRTWKFRPPPRRVQGAENSVRMCTQFAQEGFCRLANQCADAHSAEELQEWRERFDFRLKKVQKAAKLCNSFGNRLMEKLAGANNKVNQILRPSIDDVDVKCDSDLSASIATKSTVLTWNFTIETKNGRILRDIALLNTSNNGLDQFQIVHVKEMVTHEERWNDQALEQLEKNIREMIALESPKPDQQDSNENDDENSQNVNSKVQNGNDGSNSPGGNCGVSEAKVRTFQLDQNVQDWSHPNLNIMKRLNKSKVSLTYQIRVVFKTEIFGTFDQSIVFGFGQEPYLRQDLKVDVKPLSISDEDDEEAKRQDFQETVLSVERWDGTNSTIIDFTPPLNASSPEDSILYAKYPTPQPKTFKLSKSVFEPTLTSQNYRQRMHDMLYIEEMAQFEQISQYNVRTRLLVVDRYLLTTSSNAMSTAKYSRPGELFGKMTLKGNLSEDTTSGRLILTNCTSLLLKKAEKAKKTGSASSTETGNSEQSLPVYMCGIEDSGKATLYLRLSPTMVKDLNLTSDQELEVEVQFQLNRLPVCEMHYAVDKLTDLSTVYPSNKTQVSIPWTPGKQWSEELSSKLNAKQREAILAITSSPTNTLPPILIIGPFGTGKTFTLAQAIKILLKQENAKILVCTHSNSAADLYIREYLDPFISDNPDVKLLRVYFKNRWVQTVHNTVQKYCLISENREFRNPTLEDVEKCNVVVSTLSTSRVLSSIGLQSGHFTHILLDEAAQAMECEAILPLALADKKTRLVLAGDHMQLAPEVFSGFAKERRFNKSLLERLYDLYPQNFACKILLVENYRSHEAIINYTSELFYEQKLVAGTKQVPHATWYPLTYFTTSGEDVQDANSTSFHNAAEVYEVVERVGELKKSWPKDWGDWDENSIGILTHYHDQVQRIRAELRKRKLFGISVERVLNVQGKQFRVVFLSTVRTRRTCVGAHLDDAQMDFGFLSNAKLLNTAITRAQSLVAVVGDPVALCSVGKCQKLWERFIETSWKNKSLFGTTWAALKVMLDNCELNKTYVLNPLAAEFVPRARRQLLHEQQQQRVSLLQNMIAAAKAAEASAAAMQAAAAHQQRRNSNIPAFFPHAPPPPPSPMTPPFMSHAHVQAALAQAAGMHLPPPFIFPPNHQLPVFPPAVHPLMQRLPLPPPPLPLPALTRGAGQRQFMTPPPPMMPLPHQQQPRPPLALNAAHAQLSAQARPTASQQGGPRPEFLFKEGVHFPSQAVAVPKPPGAPPPLPSGSGDVIDIALSLLPLDMDIGAFLQSQSTQGAWYRHLQETKSAQDASLFKDLISQLRTNGKFLEQVKIRLGQIQQNRIHQQQQQHLAQPPPGGPRDVLMPSGASADAFFRNANGGGAGGNSNSESSILNHILKADENPVAGSPDSGIWGAPKENGASSIPLYKRSAGGAGSGVASSSLSRPSSAGLPSSPILPAENLPVGNVTPTPSGSRQLPFTPGVAERMSSPEGSGRTYANVLRQPQQAQAAGGNLAGNSNSADPLEHIRQLGNLGNSGFDNDGGRLNSFSLFGNRW